MRFAVILAGGGGTRLWPASRRARPKQFLALGSTPGESLLAATARRLAPHHVVVVTASAQANTVQSSLPSLAEPDLMIEPCGRNTAAATGLAAMRLLARDADAVIAAVPADHHIGDEAELRTVLDTAYAAAEAEDVIVTIGLKPTMLAATGYGYLQLGADRGDGTRTVTQFIEKPNAKTAADYVASGNYLWNGGMFIARASCLLDALAEHMPETFAGLVAIRDGGPDALHRIYPTLPSISIDHGVMERSRRVVCVPARIDWHDVGAWSSVAELHADDADGNVVLGDAVAIDATDNILVSTSDELIAVVGVHNLIVVRSGNATLILPRDRAQDVRRVVDTLQSTGRVDFL